MNYEEIRVNNYDINKSKKFNEFIKCFNACNAINYLEKEDLINLAKSSNSINSLVKDKNLLIKNLLYHNQSQ